MKKYIYLTLAAVLSTGLLSCTKEETVVETQNTVEEITVTADEGQKSVLVRTSGRWNVAIKDADADWISLVGSTSGVGEGAFTFAYDANRPTSVSRGLRRAAHVVVTTGDMFTSKTIVVKQAGVAPTLFFRQELVELTSDAQEVCRLPLDSNLSYKAAESFRFGVVSPQGTDWLTNFGVSKDLSSITFSCTENTTGQARVASVSVNYVDAWGQILVSTCGVQQGVPATDEGEPDVE